MIFVYMFITYVTHFCIMPSFDIFLYTSNFLSQDFLSCTMICFLFFFFGFTNMFITYVTHFCSMPSFDIFLYTSNFQSHDFFCTMIFFSSFSLGSRISCSCLIMHSLTISLILLCNLEQSLVNLYFPFSLGFLHDLGYPLLRLASLQSSIFGMFLPYAFSYSVYLYLQKPDK